MNNDRRKRIEKAQETLAELLAEIEALRDEEQEAYDNLPESLQGSDRGEAMSQAIDNLDNLRNSLEEASGFIDEILNA